MDQEVIPPAWKSIWTHDLLVMRNYFVAVQHLLPYLPIYNIFVSMGAFGLLYTWDTFCFKWLSYDG